MGRYVPESALGQVLTQAGHHAAGVVRTCIAGIGQRESVFPDLFVPVPQTPEKRSKAVPLGG